MIFYFEKSNRILIREIDPIIRSFALAADAIVVK